MNTRTNLGAEVRVLNLVPEGPLAYQEGLDWQHRLREERRAGKIPDTILFLEHRPVITLGTRGSGDDILVNEAELASRGVEVFRANRGGQVTFHGPGQLVGYFIVDLSARLRQIRAFVEGIERGLITYIKDEFDLEGHLETEHPGIWLPQGKVAAVGIAIKDKMSMHGFALNVRVDPGFFSLIVPCGISDRATINLADLIPNAPSLAEIADRLGPFLVAAISGPH